MADNFTQVLEVALKSTTDPGVRALLETVKQLGATGELTDEQLSGLVTQVAAVDKALSDTSDAHATLDNYIELAKRGREYAAELREQTDAVRAAAGIEKEAKAALDAKQQSLDEARAALASFTDGSVAYLGTEKQIAEAQRAAKATWPLPACMPMTI